LSKQKREGYFNGKNNQRKSERTNERRACRKGKERTRLSEKESWEFKTSERGKKQQREDKYRMKEEVMTTRRKEKKKN
jgi:hypothetical protein